MNFSVRKTIRETKKKRIVWKIITSVVVVQLFSGAGMSCAGVSSSAMMQSGLEFVGQWVDIVY